MIREEFDDLSNLLSAGTLEINVCPELYDEIAWQVETDGDYSEWPKTLVHATGDNLNLLQNVSFGVELSFLTKLGYIRPRWKLFSNSLLHVRVYLIPSDHPSSPKDFRSKLSQNDIANARNYLNCLLPCINHASQAWDKPAPPDDQFKPFLPVSVCCDLSYYRIQKRFGAKWICVGRKTLHLQKYSAAFHPQSCIPRRSCKVSTPV